MTLLKDVWDMIKDRAEWKELQAAARKVPDLERRISALEARMPSAVADAVCQHCGSSDIRRTGTRPAPGPFAKLGLKEAVFLCTACGGETGIEIPRR